jgi:hypothetical protein
LAIDDFHGGIIAFVAGSGCIRLLVDHMGREGFIEPEQLELAGLAAYASAANLKNAHDLVTILGHPNSMNLYDARKAVISKLKTLFRSKGVTGDSVQHGQSSLIGAA